MTEFRQIMYDYIKNTLSNTLTNQDLDILVTLMCYIFGDLYERAEKLPWQIDVDNCDEDNLKHLSSLIGYRWENGLTINEQRESIKLFLLIRKYRGTQFGLTNLIRVFGQESKSYYSSADRRSIRIYEYDPNYAEFSEPIMYPGDLLVQIPEYSEILRDALDFTRLMGTRIKFSYRLQLGEFPEGHLGWKIQAGFWYCIKKWIKPIWLNETIIAEWGPEDLSTVLSTIWDWQISFRTGAGWFIMFSSHIYTSPAVPWDKGFMFATPGMTRYLGFMLTGTPELVPMTSSNNTFEITNNQIYSWMPDKIEGNSIKSIGTSAVTTNIFDIDDFKAMTDFINNQARNVPSLTDNSSQYVRGHVTGEGQVYFDKAKEGQPIDLRIEGASKQETTTGKNLLRPSIRDNSLFNGVTFNITEDGMVSIEGTASDVIYWQIGTTSLIANTDYTLSTDFANTSDIQIYYNGEPIVSGTNWIPIDSNYTVFRVNESVTDIGVNITIRSGAIVDMKFKTQLELGTQATSYEPYTGGYPSPSPLYPQKISTVTFDKIVRYGSNLLPYPFDGTTKTENGVTFTDNGDGSITVNGTATETTYFRLYGWARDQKVLLGNYISGGAENIHINVVHYTGTDYKVLAGATTGWSKIDKSEYTTGYIEVVIYQGASISNVTIKPMLSNEAGVDWLPYQGESYSIDLQGNEMVEIPNGVKDELIIDKYGNVSLVKNVGKIVFDGSDDENWFVLDFAPRPLFDIRITDILSLPDPSIKNPTLCTSFISYSPNDIWMTNITGICIVQDSNVIRIGFKDNPYQTSEEFKSWLSTHNTILYYPLSNPQTVSLGKLTDIITTLDGANNILINGSLKAPINVSYSVNSEYLPDKCFDYTIDEDTINIKYVPVNEEMDSSLLLPVRGFQYDTNYYYSIEIKSEQPMTMVIGDKEYSVSAGDQYVSYQDTYLQETSEFESDNLPYMPHIVLTDFPREEFNFSLRYITVSDEGYDYVKYSSKFPSIIEPEYFTHLLVNSLKTTTSKGETTYPINHEVKSLGFAKDNIVFQENRTYFDKNVDSFDMINIPYLQKVDYRLVDWFEEHKIPASKYYKGTYHFRFNMLEYVPNMKLPSDKQTTNFEHHWWGCKYIEDQDVTGLQINPDGTAILGLPKYCIEYFIFQRYYLAFLMYGYITPLNSYPVFSYQANNYQEDLTSPKFAPMKTYTDSQPLYINIDANMNTNSEIHGIIPDDSIQFKVDTQFYK